MNNNINSTVVYNIDAMLDYLKEDGLRVQNCNDSVKNRYSCVITAMKSNYKAYEFIGDLYKYHDDVISLYWSGYITDQNKNIIEKNKRNDENPANNIVYDIDSTLDYLKEDGLRLQNLNESVKNRYSCVITAMKNDYKSYEYIGELYKFHPDVIDLYYTGYIKDQNKKLSDNRFINYIPECIQTNVLYTELMDNKTTVRNKK